MMNITLVLHATKLITDFKKFSLGTANCFVKSSSLIAMQNVKQIKASR